MGTTDIVLLVEDDRLDQKSVRRAFKDLNISNPLVVVENGQEALEFLRQEGGHLPMLILLDLNMPRMNGIEFLRILKGDERLKVTPVVVLTTSREEQDQTETYQLGVAGYMVKPVDYQKFIDVIRTIHLYWRMSLVLPPDKVEGKVALA